MKNILGHKSYSTEEVVAILERSGSYTCPILPHYRYQRVKTVCGDFQRRGFLRKAGRTPEAVNLVVTDLFKEWQRERRDGTTTLGLVKWHKQRNAMEVAKTV